MCTVAANMAVRTKLSLFALLAPLGLYSTLQQLAILPPWPIVPGLNAYLSVFPALISSRQRFGYLSPLAILLLIDSCRRHIGVDLTAKISQYIWILLPTPLSPDGPSLTAAKNDNFDDSDIPGLLDEKHRLAKFVNTTVTDQLARDLQDLGYAWQRWYGEWAQFVKYDIWFYWSYPEMSGRVERIDSIESDQYVAERIAMEESNRLL